MAGVINAGLNGAALRSIAAEIARSRNAHVVLTVDGERVEAKPSAEGKSTPICAAVRGLRAGGATLIRVEVDGVTYEQS